MSSLSACMDQGKAMGGPSEKVADLQSKEMTLTDTDHTGTLILNFSVSGTVRKYISVVSAL